LTESTVAVFRLSSVSYPVSTPDDFSGNSIPLGAEIAIIGTGDAAITGAQSSVYGPEVPLLSINGIVYLSSVDIHSPSTNMTAINVSSTVDQPHPATLWLDDLAITEFLHALYSGASDTYIRRSVIRSNDCLTVSGGALYLENSVLGPETGTNWNQALYASGAYLDIRYSNLWGYDWAIDCDDILPPQGAIRNSILLNEDAATSSIDPECTGITFAGNAGTDPALTAQATWFTNVDNNDFHLTTTGANQLGMTAQWASGDPLVDIDGDLRPQDSTGYAGIDQR
jgi:hypothetical protein